MRAVILALGILLLVSAASAQTNHLNECIADVKGAAAALNQIKADFTERQIVDLAQQLFRLVDLARNGADVCRNITKSEVLWYIAQRIHHLSVKCMTETYHLLMEAQQLRNAIKAKQIILSAQTGYQCYKQFKITKEACKAMLIR